LATTQAPIPEFIKQEQVQSKIMPFTNFEIDTDFVKWLQDGVFFENVRELHPSKIDMEIRDYPILKMNLLLSAISKGIDSNRDFEFYQSLLFVIFKVFFVD
jgi:hypothetical protein